MTRNLIKTDIENLNKLYEINRIYNSPKVIRNFPSKENKINSTIYLEKLAPYNYPTYVKLVKRDGHNYNSLSPQRRRFGGNNSFLSHSNLESPIKHRTYNYSTDYYTHAKNRTNNQNRYNINKINFGTPEKRNTKIKNNKIISISPSFNIKRENLDYNNNSKIDIEIGERNDLTDKRKIGNVLSQKYKIIPKTVDHFKIKKKYYRTLNPEFYNTNIPIGGINNHYEERYLTNFNENTLSYITDINQYQAQKMNRTNPYYTPYTTNNNIINEDYDDNNIFINNNYNNDIKIKLNDLIFIEGRFNDIIIALNNIRNIMDIYAIEECIEFFTFYFNSSLKNKFVYFFAEQNNVIIQTAFNLILYVIIMTFHLSLNPPMLIKVIIIVKNIFEKLKINLYLFIKKMELYYGEIFCSKNEIYFQNFNYFLIKNGIYDLSEIDIVDIISRNSVHIVNDISTILDYYNFINNRYFYDFQNIYLSLSKMNEDDFNIYFFNNLLNISEENINNNIYYNNFDNNFDNTNIYFANNNNYNLMIQNEEDEDEQYLNNVILYYKKHKEMPPFIKTKNTKKYTLVLDLGGTLINVKIDKKGRAICYLRPGIISFLTGIKRFYEIVSYTKLSKEYSNLIINQIERNRKLFDYNLYREHCVLVGNKFVKDISRIGRDMKKIIMVDDVPENLENHIENGILILPYDGENEIEEDRVLFELKKLLILFYNIGYEDLRNAIKSYKNEIFNKITLGNYD